MFFDSTQYLSTRSHVFVIKIIFKKNKFYTSKYFRSFRCKRCILEKRYIYIENIFNRKLIRISLKVNGELKSTNFQFINPIRWIFRRLPIEGKVRRFE